MIDIRVIDIDEHLSARTKIKLRNTIFIEKPHINIIS